MLKIQKTNPVFDLFWCQTFKKCFPCQIVTQKHPDLAGELRKSENFFPSYNHVFWCRKFKKFFPRRSVTQKDALLKRLFCSPLNPSINSIKTRLDPFLAMFKHPFEPF